MPLPDWIAAARSERITIGCSKASIVRLVDPNGDICYLKSMPSTLRKPLLEERWRLEWMRERLPVPDVLAYVEEDGAEHLLTTSLPGVDCSDRSHLDDPPLLVTLLADGLRMLHATPIADCPFDGRLEVKLERARARMEEGLVDESDFDEKRSGRSARELFDELVRTKPASEDLVFTHGDYSLPNIIVDGDRVSGFVDVGEAGVADRYADLALAARSLEYNFGREWVELLFERYGIAPDARRIEFYQLLDEFF